MKHMERIKKTLVKSKNLVVRFVDEHDAEISIGVFIVILLVIARYGYSKFKRFSQAGKYAIPDTMRVLVTTEDGWQKTMLYKDLLEAATEAGYATKDGINFFKTVM